MNSLKIKTLAFKRLFPTAEIILFDNLTQSLEIDGKITSLEKINLEKEFLKTKENLEKKIKDTNNQKGV